MAEAQRLNMVGGHFIWIWADTSSTAEFFQPHHNVGNVPNVVEKDAIMAVKENYDNHMDEYMERKSKYNNLDITPTENRRPQNYTRYKQTNINRFHHIIGLRKNPNDKNSEGENDSDDIESIVGQKSFLKSLQSNKSDKQIPIKEKRFNYNQKSTSNINNRSRKQPNANSNYFSSDENEFTSSVENSKANSFNRNTLHIKNINSDEFNANYYDLSSSSASIDQSIDSTNDNAENEYSEFSSSMSANNNPNSNGDFVEDFENVYGDYIGGSYEILENPNPYVPTTSRRPPITSTSLPTKHQSITTSTNSPIQSQGKILMKSMEKSTRNQMKSLKSGKTSKIQEGNKNDDIHLDEDESVENSNDWKSKRANFPSNTFNVSSHVFFHHFKDFPVGLLALKPVKMNVDRHFIRSAIRLFASTWSRVEKDEEQKLMNRNRGKTFVNWDEWRNNDSDEYDESYSNKNNQKSNRNYNSNVNTRYNTNNNNNNNSRGRKFKRETVEISNQASILNSVNNTLSSQNNTNKILSGLNNITKSNNDSNSSNVNNQNNNISSEISNLNREKFVESPLSGKIEVEKRQNTWWSGSSFRGKNQEKFRGRGTPQYRGGCFGTPNRGDVRRAESFSR
jgi:hypothetical protein